MQGQDTTEAVDQFGNRTRVPLIRGDWKKLPNNPLTADGSIHEYCPPDFVQDEMDMLLQLYHQHQSAGVRPEVEAAWLHHRFTQIHPFQDGNGRVARALSTMVFLKARFLPLVIRDLEHRDSYIQALEDADHGDLRPLTSLFANIQAKDIEDAITFVREMRGEGIRAIAMSAADATKRRMQQDEDAIAGITDTLIDITFSRLEEIDFELRQAFEEAGARLDVNVSRDSVDNHTWWTHQIVSAAKEYNYFADFSRFRHWVRMRLGIVTINSPRWHVVVSFHHKEQRAGLMAAVVFLTTSEADFEDVRPVILGAANEFTYSSTSRQYEDAFRTWLEDALSRVLEVWQSRL